MSQQAGNQSNRMGAIPKGKNKYTLAPIDHQKGLSKANNN
jgi:hypothetical protein